MASIDNSSRNTQRMREHALLKQMNNFNKSDHEYIDLCMCTEHVLNIQELVALNSLKRLPVSVVSTISTSDCSSSHNENNSATGSDNPDDDSMDIDNFDDDGENDENIEGTVRKDGHEIKKRENQKVEEISETESSHVNTCFDCKKNDDNDSVNFNESISKQENFDDSKNSTANEMKDNKSVDRKYKNNTENANFACESTKKKENKGDKKKKGKKKGRTIKEKVIETVEEKSEELSYGDAIDILKANPTNRALTSDVDEQIIIYIPFAIPVSIQCLTFRADHPPVRKITTKIIKKLQIKKLKKNSKNTTKIDDRDEKKEDADRNDEKKHTSSNDIISISTTQKRNNSEGDHANENGSNKDKKSDDTTNDEDTTEKEKCNIDNTKNMKIQHENTNIDSDHMRKNDDNKETKNECEENCKNDEKHINVGASNSSLISSDNDQYDTQIIDLQEFKFDETPLPDISAPRTIKLFGNMDMLDFGDIEDAKAHQIIELENDDVYGEKKIQLKGSRFQLCTSIQIFVESNQADTEKTFLNRVALWGNVVEAYSQK